MGGVCCPRVESRWDREALPGGGVRWAALLLASAEGWQDGDGVIR